VKERLASFQLHRGIPGPDSMAEAGKGSTGRAPVPRGSRRPVPRCRPDSGSGWRAQIKTLDLRGRRLEWSGNPIPMPNEGGDRTDDLPASDPPAFRLDGCRVEPALNRVVKGRSVIQVEPKVMAVLLQLVARRGGVCSRRELMERVWADIHVGEDVLTRSVAELRRIFDDDPREPRVIDTIRKRGYRLIPEPVFDGSPGAGVRDPATEPPSRRALTWARLLARLALAAGMAAVVVGLALTLPGSREPTHAERRDDPAPAPRLARLTSRPGTERDPAVSPDGTRVAYTVFEPSGSVAHLFVQSRGAEDRLRLTSGLFEDRYPAWSSDGTRLAFVRRSPEGCHLHIGPWGGRAPRGHL
jgi:DNA-binding winged helix-turn-helix (wHTH) protein